MKKLFSKQLEQLDYIISKNEFDTSSIRKFSDSSFSNNIENEGVLAINEVQTGISVSNNDKVIAQVDFSELANLFGTHRFSFYQPKIGSHPDFEYLQHNDYENHYAVSMFIDIKSSTLLSKKYNLHQIRKIKDTILSLSIEVCSFFGGHIQRLQGDGLFVYFVKRKIDAKDAIINSLNAASVLAYFIKNDLPSHFNKDGVEAPKIRIGIDYGSKEETLWSYYGLSMANELTTTGLHTDLAAKLQSEAKENGVLIGENLVKELDLQDYIVSCNPSDSYIFNRTYKKYNFKWENYLNTFDFMQKNDDGSTIFDKPEYWIKCEIAKGENEQFKIYHQNLFSIPKGYKIKFTLMHYEHPYVLKEHYKEKTDWKIINTGKQAKDHEIQQLESDTNSCIVDAEYLGQHKMECKTNKAGFTPISAKFYVFVK